LVKSDVFTIKEIWKWRQTMFSHLFVIYFIFIYFLNCKMYVFIIMFDIFVIVLFLFLQKTKNNFIIFFCYQMSRRLLLIFFLGILFIDTDKFKNTLCHLLTKRENEDDNSFTIFCYLCLLFVEVPTCISLG